MIAIEFSVSIFYLIGLVVMSFVIGFLVRAAQIKIGRKKILELEREMLNNHARILELEKERAGLMRQMKEPESGRRETSNVRRET